MANIKWRKKDITKLTNYIRKFNASITKTSKKFPELADAGVLPERLDIQEVKSRILTRSDYNIELARIDRWFRPGSRKIVTTSAGFKMTKWEYNEAVYADRRRKRNNKKQIQISKLTPEQAEKIGIYTRDTVENKLKELGKKVGDKSRYNNLTAADAISDWRSFVYSLFQESSSNYEGRMEAQYLDNFMQAAYEQMTPHYFTLLANFITNNNITGFQLVLLGDYDPAINFEYVYSPEEQEHKSEQIYNRLVKSYSELYLYGESSG